MAFAIFPLFLMALRPTPNEGIKKNGEDYDSTPFCNLQLSLFAHDHFSA